MDGDRTSAGGNRQRLLAVWPHKCVFVVEEILKTEEDYVESLRQIIEVTEMYYPYGVYAC